MGTIINLNMRNDKKLDISANSFFSVSLTIRQHGMHPENCMNFSLNTSIVLAQL